MQAPEIQPVPRESTSEIIARQLRAAITDGTIAAGSQLGEADLAARFAVSRGPLREAMQRLVQEGLLRSERHRGLFVIELSADDICDIYAARTAVECAAVSAILRAGAHQELADLEQAQDELRVASAQGDLRQISQSDLDFHATLVASCASPRLGRMMNTLLAETRMCLAALAEQPPVDGAQDRVAEHATILTAIRSGDERGAFHALELHMEDAVRRLAPGRSLLLHTTTGGAPRSPH